MSNTSNTSRTQNAQKPRSSPRAGKSSQTRESRRENQRDSDQEDDTANRRPKPMEVLRHARGQLAELTGMQPESVSSFEQTEDGWTLEIEVMELARVPDTMSLMASYQVELDPEGELTGYRKVRRYERGRADPHRQGGR
ncbi:gas vesicle protein [Streptomyces phyllanthi]|uniref:Gas vesicle protein n=1 Tax=Streptomyces phyllanthi TaxID=1803180 RepID=A0A5N8W8V1_9ACTN|nr:gas vesicle protein [Streptomyces phyllanthi]MPY42848.1 gas vesicle protein [Streptomyces phyllanthi]